tara:strand:- start:707 stop:898 length:192 start_codon:yes stop_codon:yes gene_type:complete
MQFSYSIKEVAIVTGLGRTKIYEAINNGLLPAKKYGKRTIVLKADIEAFLKQLGDYNEINTNL